MDEIQRYRDEDLPHVVVKEVVDHFQDSFVNEGFTDQAVKNVAESIKQIATKNLLILCLSKNICEIEKLNYLGKYILIVRRQCLRTIKNNDTLRGMQKSLLHGKCHSNFRKTPNI
jgi:hypothetical protein